MKERLCTDPQNAGQNQVHCDVNSCRYNDHAGICTAKEIRIGPAFAALSSETSCSTFQPQ